MQGKKEYREPARSTRSTCNGKPARYRCIACDRPRSSTYHLRHPPEEPPPPQGICRRCIDKEKQKEHLPPPLAITIYEIHYYHACTCKREQRCASTHVELPPPPAHPGCAELTAGDREAGSLPLSPAHPVYAELPAEGRKGGSLPLYHLPLYHLFERVPPPVKFETKPNFRSG
jgi:hypothetical protein